MIGYVWQEMLTKAARQETLVASGPLPEIRLVVIFARHPRITTYLPTVYLILTYCEIWWRCFVCELTALTSNNRLGFYSIILTYKSYFYNFIDL